MKGYTGIEVQLNSFLTLPADGGEWSASRPRHFNARVNASDIHSIVGWVGPRTGIDVLGMRKKLLPLPRSEPRLVQPVL